MSDFKKQDIVTVLTYISRKETDREEVLQQLSQEVLYADDIVDYLLEEELIANREGTFSITKKGLKKARCFYEKPLHVKEKTKSQKRRGLIQAAMLQLLKEQPRHGYEVMKLLEKRSEGVYSPSAGTVYPALQDLCEKGLISIDEQKDKKVYTLTEAGLTFLAQMIHDEDEVFWEEWRLRLLWKQSKEAVLIREEMEKFQLEFQHAMKSVLHNPSLAPELAEMIKSGKENLIHWSQTKAKKQSERQGDSK
ncbi:PadR family transcriptional regulator [Domibacillus robiginosus]|uniref:PadR family transcriptional regulator n=1 Tax=Domibacillus robiginosus TaxID=1071054 RepID=UPI00067B531B|nr:PadR family transcriptional regulator [Domibacillus robiginosus]